MEKLKVIVTGMIPKEGVVKLQEVFEVNYSEEPFSREYVLENLHKYDAVLLMGLKADKEFIDAGSKLKIIATNSVGFDHIDLEYARSKGILVANCPNAVRKPTAEMTVALMLAATKRLVDYDHNIRNNNWLNVSDRKNMGFSLYDRTLGVYGMGRIGKTVALIAQSLGMNIIYNNDVRIPEDEELGFKFVSFDELVTSSDVITIHVPYLESTRHKFNKEVFKKMKPTSYLINAARGAIVNEDDMIHALSAGLIAGAGLDVFENEPHPSKELLQMYNVVMSPHAGTGTLAARIGIAEEASENIISFLLDSKPVNIVN